jgi:APA family basic amino acid/polyamine antiporter
VLLTGISYFGIKAGAMLQKRADDAQAARRRRARRDRRVHRAPHAPSAPGAVSTGRSVWNFGAILMPVLFAYGGWAYVNNIAGEIREPQRNLPRALVLWACCWSRRAICWQTSPT